MKSLTLVVLLAFLAAPGALIAAPAVGDRVPAFSMQGSDGNTYSDESLAGQGFVIAFFPKAFTSG